MKNSYFWGKNTHDMLNIDILTFNLFEEKTYIVSQGNGYCVIVDPGCSNEAERQTLIKALTDKSLTPTAVLLTHGHLDHVYGAAFIQKTYRDIPVYLNPADIKVMELTGAMAQKFHMEAPEIGFKTTDIHDSDTLSAAGISFNVILAECATTSRTRASCSPEIPFLPELSDAQISDMGNMMTRFDQ